MNRPGGGGEPPRQAPLKPNAPLPPVQPQRRPEPESGGSKLVPIALSVLLLGGGGFAAMKFLGGSPAPEPTPQMPVHRQVAAAPPSPLPPASGSPSPIPGVSSTALPSATPTDASTELSEGDKLMATATENLKASDATTAVANAQKAVDFFGKPGADAAKLTAAQALLRKATIALADGKVEQAKDLVTQRKFRTAESTAKEAEDLYAKFEGTDKGKQQAVAVQEDARAQLNAARTLRTSATPVPAGTPRPDFSGTPNPAASPGEGFSPDETPSPKAPQS